MLLPPQFLDEIRARTLLSSVVGRQVKLQKAGREFKACCPFHSEKTASFYVNDEKGFYHCFGCSAHGDAIRFLTDARGLPFMDAVKELADAAGLELPAPDPKARERTEAANSLYEVMEVAASWFEQQLVSLDGAEARAYLQRRGVSEQSIKRFRIGFAPNSRNRLALALNDLGQEKLVEAGLLIQLEEKKEPYDRFRGRLIIPIRDQRGRVIAFGGRLLGEGEPKYLNSPETPLFDKGSTLFNIDRAGTASREAHRLIVVEGYMDVIALDQAGMSEAVAPLGTALTETQIERLWRLSDRPLLCFDGDKAGQRAATRAALRALPLAEPGKTLGFVPLPTGQDPDDLIKAGGTAALKLFLTKAEGLASRIWRDELEQVDYTSPESRAGLQERLNERASSIRNSFVREEYKRTFRDLFFETFGWKKRAIEGVRNAIAESRPRGQAKGDYALLRAVLLGLTRYPEVLRENLETAASLEIDDLKLRRWFDILCQAVLDHPYVDEDLVEAILASSEIGPVEKRDICRDLGFSFFRRREPERARSELQEVIATLVAERQVERALAKADARLAQATEVYEWQEQQRLLAARKDIATKLSLFAERAVESEVA